MARQRPARPMEKKMYKVEFWDFYNEPPEIRIHSANIVKETEYFYMTDVDLDYHKRHSKAGAVTDLKKHLEHLFVNRVKAIEKIKTEIKLLEDELEKL